MKRIDRGIAAVVGLSAWAGIALVVAPGRTSLVGHLWLVAVLAIGVAVAVAALEAAVPRRPSAFDAAFSQAPRGRAGPASLAALEREVTLACGTAFDVHYRLRPTLRRLASGLVAQRGVDLDRSPDRAAALVGPAVWELVRPERPAPADRTAPGLSVETIEHLVDGLERLA